MILDSSKLRAEVLFDRAFKEHLIRMEGNVYVYQELRMDKERFINSIAGNDDLGKTIQSLLDAKTPS